MSIVIGTTSVRLDSAGRFSLNDLHLAAGGQHKHRPSFWLQNKQAQEIIADRLISGNPELPPVAAQRGRYGGTWAIKPLVYSYAMWVSPRFHNQVVDAYDAMARVADPGHVIPTTLAQSLRDMADLVEKNEALTKQVAEAAEPIEFFGAVAVAPGTQTFREVGKVYDMSDRQLI
ncbi:MAG TPA: KilA-N domain-containing protein, partial [Rhodanobacter sp.]|nr:KilA-N domain-containing protein [Rhodanobacter sp.]